VARPDLQYEVLKQAAGNVSRETFERLKAFDVRFRQWNARINLAAASTLDDLWTRHIVDSAQLLRLRPGNGHWLDVGSGGGFPGLVIAFLLQDGRITLVESNRKKAGFLSAMIGEFGLPAEVLAVRIEDASAKVHRADVVTARALAALPDLLSLAAPWLTTGACGLFHKGRDYRAEVSESARLWQFDLVEHVSVTDEEAVILQVDQLRPVVREAKG
jgi:16S rRNA (guanine527-N7)-methyltransferase